MLVGFDTTGSDPACIDWGYMTIWKDDECTAEQVEESDDLITIAFEDSGSSGKGGPDDIYVGPHVQVNTDKAQEKVSYYASRRTKSGKISCSEFTIMVEDCP